MKNLQIDIAVAAGDWGDGEDWRPLAEGAIAAAAGAAELVFARKSELSILLTDDEEIRRLNAKWRGIDKPTNVLSFPADLQAGVPVAMLGDIVLAHETIRREAELAGKRFEDHVSHLLVHGFLHLFGYDHLEEQQAEEMERLEREALRELGIGDPYDLAG